MYNTHVLTNDGCVSGEVKIAIILNLLGGGDAHDLRVIFDIEPYHCRSMIYDIVLM